MWGLDFPNTFSDTGRRTRTCSCATDLHTPNANLYTADANVHSTNAHLYTTNAHVHTAASTTQANAAAATTVRATCATGAARSSEAKSDHCTCRAYAAAIRCSKAPAAATNTIVYPINTGNSTKGTDSTATTETDCGEAIKRTDL